MPKFVNGDRALIHCDDDPLNGFKVTVVGYLGRLIRKSQEDYIVVLDSPHILDGWSAGVVAETCLSKIDDPV